MKLLTPLLGVRKEYVLDFQVLRSKSRRTWALWLTVELWSETLVEAMESK